MWKIALGFAVFAALALYVVTQGGDKLSMAGETHASDTHAASAPASAASR